MGGAAVGLSPPLHAVSLSSQLPCGPRGAWPALSWSAVLPRLTPLLLAGQGPLRKCEQRLQFEIAHQLGQDPVRYDATGWVSRAKWNLSAQNAIQVLQQSKV